MREKEAGRPKVNRATEEQRVQSIVAFHWLSYDRPAELWTGKKCKPFFFLLGSAVVAGHESSLSGLNFI